MTTLSVATFIPGILLAFIASPCPGQASRLRVRGNAVVSLVNGLTGEMYTRSDVRLETVPLATVRTEKGGWTDLAAGDGVALVTDLRTQGEDALVSLEANSKQAGLAGAWLALGPVDAEHVKLLLPALGGVCLDQTWTLREKVFVYSSWEWATPALVVQGERGGFLVWADDPLRRFVRLRVVRTRPAWHLALYTEAEPPWDKQTRCVSPTWRFRAYRGPWTVAAHTLDKWLRRSRPAAVLPARGDRRWVRDIRCVVRVINHGPCRESLQKLAAELDPGAVLLYVPDWRRHPYDTLYPEYAPAAETVEFIREAHALGFKVMVHGNLLGMSTHHPRAAEFKRFVQRFPADDAPVGWRLDHDSPTSMYLLNPAYPQVRQWLVGKYVESRQTTPFDALHLDYPGTANSSSGRVDGVNVIQGVELLLGELRRALPGVAFSTEGLADYLLACDFAQDGDAHLNDAVPDPAFHPIQAAMFAGLCRRYAHLAVPNQDRRLRAYLRYAAVLERLGALPTLTMDRAKEFDPTRPGTAVALRWAKHYGTHRLRPAFAPLLSPVSWNGKKVSPRAAWEGSDHNLTLAVQTEAGRLYLTRTGAAALEELGRVAMGVRRLPLTPFVPGWCAYDRRRQFGLHPDGIYLPSPKEEPDPSAFHLLASSVPVVVSGGEEDVRSVLYVRAVRPATIDLLTMLPERTDAVIGGKRMRMGRGAAAQVECGRCGGVCLQGLFMHPPWRVDRRRKHLPLQTTATYRVQLPDKDGIVFRAWAGRRDGPDGKRPGGDGMTFAVEVDSTLVFRRHSAGDDWLPVAVNLEPWRGREIVLRLVADAGPKGNTAFDWGFWARPRIEVPQRARLRLVPPRKADSLIVADGAGERRLPGEAAELDVVLPAALIYPRRAEEVDGEGSLLQRPYRTSRCIAGVFEPGGVWNAGKQGRYSDGKAERKGLYGHPPDHGQTHLEWLLHLPATMKLRLTFGTAVLPGGNKVRFEVRINGRLRWERLCAGGSRWLDGRVDLSAQAGKTVLLSLVTDSVGSAHSDWAVWSEPRLTAAADDEQRP